MTQCETSYCYLHLYVALPNVPALVEPHLTITGRAAAFDRKQRCCLDVEAFQTALANRTRTL